MGDLELIQQRLGVVPNFPKQGITFLDLNPVLRDPLLFETLITHLVYHLTSVTMPSLDSKKINVVVGLEARGFLIAPIIALRLGAAFVPVRKKDKLPGPKVSVGYGKEYGTDIFEMQEGSIKPEDNVIVVDDVIATGGSAEAAGKLVQKLGGKTVEYLFVIELPLLKGTKKLDAPSYVMIKAEG